MGKIKFKKLITAVIVDIVLFCIVIYTSSKYYYTNEVKEWYMITKGYPLKFVTISNKGILIDYQYALIDFALVTLFGCFIVAQLSRQKFNIFIMN